MKHEPDTILCFRIDELRFAIPIHAIKTIIRSVALTPVTGTSEVIQGMMDYRGRVLPVINLRRRFNLSEKEIGIDQKFIVVKYNSSRFAIIADSVEELVEPESLKLSTVELPARADLHGEATKYGVEILQFHSDKKGILCIYDIAKLVGTTGLTEIESFLRQHEK